MVPVVAHSLKGHCLSVAVNAATEKGLELRDLCTFPLADGGFKDGILQHITLLDADCHFKEGKFWQQWSAEGRACEKAGPYLLDGQEFGLRDLLEHIYEKERQHVV